MITVTISSAVGLLVGVAGALRGRGLLAALKRRGRRLVGSAPVRHMFQLFKPYVGEHSPQGLAAAEQAADDAAHEAAGNTQAFPVVTL